MKVDLKQLNKLVDEKLISVQKHWETDYLIYNYTEKAQFDRVWNNATMMCRGLIVDGGGNILARPFKKFFNLSEHDAEGMTPIPNQPFKVYEKLDGSLGILYWIENVPYIATRGSFESEQAIEATKILRTKYFDVKFNRDFTYLFEIIYPANKIVVDYGKTRDLYLLAVINTETGDELTDLDSSYSWENVGLKNKFPIPKTYDFKNIEEIKALMSVGKGDDEGFVIKFDGGLRVKIKYDEYVRLHRLITGVNKRRIWDILRNGLTTEELLTKVPDEFFNWVVKTEKELRAEYKNLEDKAQKTYKIIIKDVMKEYKTINLSDPAVRKAFALRAVKTEEVRSIVFSIFNHRNYEAMIWKFIRPKAEKPFKDVGGDI